MKRKPATVAMIVASAFPANHGTPGSVINICRQLQETGLTVHVITYPVSEYEVPFQMNVHRPIKKTTHGDTFKVGPSWQRLGYDFLMIFKTISVVLKYDIDIIHTHNYEGQLVGFAASLFTGRPVVYHAHNNMADELTQYSGMKPKFLVAGLAKLLDRLIPKTGDQIICISNALYRFFINQGISARRLTMLPLSVVMYSGEGYRLDEIKQKYQLPPCPNVIYSGTLDRFQRLDYLVQAFAEVRAGFPGASLILVVNNYQPGQLAQIKQMSRELSIDDAICYVFDSTLEELPLLLKSGDIAVVSRPECPGFPVKILNYMAAGLPTVCFQGSAKCIEHEKTGLLAEDHRVDQLAANIERLLSDARLRHRLGRNAKTAFHRMTAESSAEKIIDVYQKAWA